MYGGMRGIKGLVTETSVLDPEEGIRLRGYTIKDCQELLPKAPNGEEPLPEGVLFLLLTGQIPSVEQVKAISKDLVARASIPNHVVTLLKNMPISVHPMSQLVSATAALNAESKFVAAYNKGVNKNVYWEVGQYLTFSPKFIYLNFITCLISSMLTKIPWILLRNCRL